MWVPPETKDPILLHHPMRRSVGYFSAVESGWLDQAIRKLDAEFPN